MTSKTNFYNSVQQTCLGTITHKAIYQKCGDGVWYSAAHFNMSDPLYQCPPAWREYNNSGVRACGRPVTSTGSCSATVYTIGLKYRKACGRVIGYQVTSPDAFTHHLDAWY